MLTDAAFGGNMNPNGNKIMADADPTKTRVLRLNKALEHARAHIRSGQPSNESDVLKPAKVIAKTQSAIKYPNNSTALRRVVSEVQKTEKEPTTFRIRLPAKTTLPSEVEPPRTRIEPPKVKWKVKESGRVALRRPALGTDFRTIAHVSDVGEVVRRARKQREMTQGELATLAGTGRRFISELEAGKPTLEFERILKVCAVLDVDLFAKARSDGG